ncbi:MAG TPA: hypothetical protein DCQ06_12850 [Myxococcales bacterium]|nr:hypothetical protein [Myxococcales bacterium]HAN32477.1 hypothetical protein [Myxococcales bacterium]
MSNEKPSALSVAILRAVLYADLFDFPIGAAEIQQQLVLQPATEDQVRAQLHSCSWLAQRVQASGQLYHLNGRQRLLSRRISQERATDALIDKHRAVLRTLKGLPYVRMVAFSGGTSRKNSVNEEDLDLFIITEKRRVWVVYALMVLVSRALGCREALCANYLVDHENVTVPDGGDLFTGHELVALVPIEGAHWLQHMKTNNPWVSTLLPNATQQGQPDRWRSQVAQPRLRRLAELAFWPCWWTIERLSRWIFGRRIRSKTLQSSDVLLTQGMMKLHTNDNRGAIVTRYRDALIKADLLSSDIEAVLGRRLRPQNRDAA